MNQPLGALYGLQPAPRVLFVYGLEEALDVVKACAEKLRNQIPAYRICHWRRLSELRQQDYELAIAFGDIPSIDHQLHLLQFGGINIGTVTHRLPDRIITAQVGRTGSSYASRWHIPATLSDACQLLVKQDLLPLVPVGAPRGDQNLLYAKVIETKPTYAGWPNEYEMEPLLWDEDGQPFALKYKRSQDPDRWHWVLPLEANHAKWASQVLRELNALNPTHFPIRTNWADDNRYMTAAEHAAHHELEAVQLNAAEVLRELADREQELGKALDQVQQAAETGPRMLVRAQGDELVGHVATALRAMGFDVINSDENATPGDKLEDLQVRLNRDSVEVALVEVRSYGGGAALNDLLRMSRFATRYAAKNGHPPARQWYIANQFAGRPPDDRARPLASNRSEVETFAEDGGLVLDTADLLELWMRVERGALPRDTARDHLWNSMGYFVAP